jgi:hypothetical protein
MTIPIFLVEVWNFFELFQIFLSDSIPSHSIKTKIFIIIFAKFEDPPKNYGSPGADFIGLKQIRNASQRKSIFLLIFSGIFCRRNY